jgi:hypothetical protein
MSSMFVHPLNGYCFFAATQQKNTPHPIVSGDAISTTLAASKAYLKGIGGTPPRTLVQAWVGGMAATPHTCSNVVYRSVRYGFSIVCHWLLTQKTHPIPDFEYPYPLCTMPTSPPDERPVPLTISSLQRHLRLHLGRVVSRYLSQRAAMLPGSTRPMT